MSTVLWFRRDLRLADNPAAHAAATDGEVVGLFCLDPFLLDRAGPNRVAHLFDCLRSLDESLDGRLVVRVGNPAEVVVAVAAEASASRVIAAVDAGPYGRRRDAIVSEELDRSNRELAHVGSPYAVPPGTVATKGGTPYRVFTPFSRAWTAHGWPAPVAAPTGVTWIDLPSDPMPRADVEPSATLTAGEAAAHARLDAFLDDAVHRYHEDRDRPDRAGTSHLSVDLKFGTLHPRQVLDRLPEGEGGHRLASELAWRDFYADVLWHRPESARVPLDATVGSIPVDHAPDLFAAWCDGMTGYPIIDAGMRQLVAEGWMHNRIRMLTASFLVKDLHLAWRDGARWFMRHLLDGDLPSNQHGWQWTAGCGTDAAPYFRIFNPTTQAKRFDPEGAYVRRYIPELRSVPTRWVHEPWRSPDGPPTGYPGPVVDHAEERAEALRRYEARRR